MKKPLLLLFNVLTTTIMVASCFVTTDAWSNGGYSTDPTQPVYGTHDWIAQHALDWLPTNEKQYLTDNLAAYLYGTELPDNSNPSAPGHIGDTSNHHFYFRSTGVLQEDAAAVRASEEYQNALSRLNAGNLSGAATTAGIMGHYIADVAVFAHVMGANTDWGAETGNNHANYESYVETRTDTYSDTYNSYLLFDGVLSTISAYDAAKNLAYDTTFDHGGIYTCVWMNNNYDTSNPDSPYWVRAGESLNLAVNAVADVLHTLYISSNGQPTPTPTPTPSPTPTQTGTDHIVINEIEQNPTGTDAGNEYVELYNPTLRSVDISGWTLSTTAGETVTLTILSGTVIQLKGYYLVTSGSQWLDNSGESVILKNFSGNEVDRTPSFSDADNDGWSWQRYPNGQDTDLTADWAFRLSTRGVSNGGTPTPTPTPTPSPTSNPPPTTPTPTPSPSPSPTPDPTAAPTVSPTTVPTNTAPIATASPTLHPTATPTQTLTPTPTSFKTPVPSPTISEFPQIIIMLIVATIFLIFTLGLVAYHRHKS